MRTRIFRILAGLIAVLFVTTVDYSGRSLRERVGLGFVIALFATYAVLGPRASHRWLQFWVPAARKREIEIDEERRDELPPTKDERQSPAAPDQFR